MPLCVRVCVHAHVFSVSQTPRVKRQRFLEPLEADTLGESGRGHVFIASSPWATFLASLGNGDKGGACVLGLLSRS